MTITDEYMSSEHTSARGWPSEPSQPYGEWAVSWCLERVLTRNQAITAMVLAEEVAACAHTGKTWLFIEAHADELGLPASTAVKWLGRTV